LCLYVIEETEPQCSSSSGTEDTIRDYVNITHVSESFNEPSPSDAKELIKGKTQVIIDKLVAVLDECRIIDRGAVRIVIAIGEALHNNLDESIINLPYIQRCRHRLCAECTGKLRETFELGSSLATSIGDEPLFIRTGKCCQSHKKFE
jgi:hypothetical protein